MPINVFLDKKLLKEIQEYCIRDAAEQAARQHVDDARNYMMYGLIRDYYDYARSETPSVIEVKARLVESVDNGDSGPD